MKGSYTIGSRNHRNHRNPCCPSDANHPIIILNAYNKQDVLYYNSLLYSLRYPLDNIILSYCNQKKNRSVIGPVLSKMLDSAYFDDRTQKRCIDYALECNDFEVVNMFGNSGFNLCNKKTLTSALVEFGDNYVSLANYILTSPEFIHLGMRKTKKRRLGKGRTKQYGMYFV